MTQQEIQITMKGIYLTEEGKQEIEAKISKLEIKLEKYVQYCKITGCHYDYQFEQGIEFYKEILSLATILPVYSNWEDVELYPPDNESQNVKTLELENGVIIQPKK
jgi:hypothetical protein